VNECLQVLALPPPSAGPPPPPASTQPGTRPPFIASAAGVGGASNVRPMGVGRGVVNGGSPANSLTNQPSITDIAAGALLIASVVQGQYWHDKVVCPSVCLCLLSASVVQGWYCISLANSITHSSFSYWRDTVVCLSICL